MENQSVIEIFDGFDLIPKGLGKYGLTICVDFRDCSCSRYEIYKYCSVCAIIFTTITPFNNIAYLEGVTGEGEVMIK